MAGGCSIHLLGLDELAALHPQAAFSWHLRCHVYGRLRHFCQVLHRVRSVHHCLRPKLLSCKFETGNICVNVSQVYIVEFRQFSCKIGYFRSSHYLELIFINTAVM